MSTSFSHLSHSLRVTVCFDVSDNNTRGSVSSADVCLPAAASLSDALPELQELASAPIISSPWQAQTAAGRVVDLSKPVAQTGIGHGDTIHFTPFEPLPVPLKKDAADALSDLGNDVDARGLSTVALCCGAVGLATLASHSSLPTVPDFVVFALLAVLLTALTAWVRVLAPEELLARNVLAVWSAVASGVCMWKLIAESASSLSVQQAGWLCLASLCAAGGVFGFLAWIAELSLTLVSAVGAAVLLGLVWSVALLWSTPIAHGAATVVIVAFLLLLITPSVAVNIVGLKVPALPAAGQDLKVADQSISDPDRRARAASRLLDGLTLGTSLLATSALGALGIARFQPGFTTALCLACSLACILHAARHRSTLAMWGLWLWSFAGLLFGTVTGLQAGQFGVLAVLVAGLAALTAPLWAGLVTSLPPTMLNWLERFEALALAAVFPLAAHLAGLFDAIRSISL